MFPRIDLLGENVAAFRRSYDWFAVLFTAFLSALHVGIPAFTLGYSYYLYETLHVPGS